MENTNVLVIGAGPAGLSAALYLNKYGLKTVVLGDNRTIMKSAVLHQTYLGLQDTVFGEDFIEQAVQQVETAGVTVLNETVTGIERTEAGFQVTSGEQVHTATHLIIATGNLVTLAEGFGLEVEENDEPFINKRIKTDNRYRTSVENIYAAGIAVGLASQAIICAGNGAQVALNLISDLADKRVCIHDSKKNFVTQS